MSETEQSELARVWLKSANNNVRMCELALAEELYTESAFNAQQAAEK